MKQNFIPIQKLCAAAILLAAGIIMPILFHMIGGPAAGGMLLPMHIPVLIAGLFLGPFYGSAVGMVTPIASFLITGMPNALKLPFTILELVSYGFLSGFLQSKKCNLYISLIGAQMGGRLVSAAALLLLSGILKLNVPPVATAGSALIAGIPGVIVQLIFIPVIIRLLRKVLSNDRYSES